MLLLRADYLGLLLDGPCISTARKSGRVTGVGGPPPPWAALALQAAFQGLTVLEVRVGSDLEGDTRGKVLGCKIAWMDASWTVSKVLCGEG